MRIRSIIFLISTFVFLVSSCVAPLSYRRSLRQWTRHDNLYSYETLAAEILWHATYLSPEYQATARAKVNEWKKLEPYDMSAQASYLMENEPGTFLVSIYLPRSYPSITENADNFWEFTLNLPSGEALVPSSIKSVRITPREERLFPYVNRWSSFYEIKFPVGNLDRPFALVLRSAGATSILEWN